MDFGLGVSCSGRLPWPRGDPSTAFPGTKIGARILGPRSLGSHSMLAADDASTPFTKTTMKLLYKDSSRIKKQWSYICPRVWKSINNSLIGCEFSTLSSGKKMHPKVHRAHEICPPPSLSFFALLNTADNCTSLSREDTTANMFSAGKRAQSMGNKNKGEGGEALNKEIPVRAKIPVVWTTAASISSTKTEAKRQAQSSYSKRCLGISLYLPFLQPCGWGGHHFFRYRGFPPANRESVCVCVCCAQVGRWQIPLQGPFAVGEDQ